jgi:hypothetical protein
MVRGQPQRPALCRSRIFATWLPAKGQTVQLAWTGLIGAQPPLNGLQSEYALNYPVQNLRAIWTVALKHS